jgi:hypothetical protein
MTAKLQPITRRRARFVREYLASCGNATAAARAAGYSRSGASVTGSNLLNDDRILAAIVAEARSGAPSAAAAVRRLLLPSRPAASRVRVEMLLAAEAPAPALIGITRPYLAIDPSDAALRDHVARDSAALGAEFRCQASPPKPKRLNTR